MAGEEEEGVIDGGADKATCGKEGGGGSREGGGVKVAKADGDRALAGCASREVGVRKRFAEGVQEDCGAHEEDVAQELHEGGVAVKGDAP